MEVNYSIPGLYEHYTLNFSLLDLMKKRPELFNDNTKIEACYGNFQFCLFDGGRVFNQYRQTTKEEMEFIINEYNNVYQVPVRLIFTSNQLKPEHFYDRFCNVILELCHNDMNQIVLVDDNLREYIHERFPKYSFISSTTKCLTNAEDLRKELKNPNFIETCLDYNLNKNFKLLELFSEEEKNKSEFLINAICPPGCPNRKDHYRLNSLLYLNYNKEYRVPQCPILGNTLDPITTCSKNNLSPQEIYEKYAPMGFKHFKLEGRTLPDIEIACNYVKYLVKPEYQYLVLSMLNINGTNKDDKFDLK